MKVPSWVLVVAVTMLAPALQAAADRRPTELDLAARIAAQTAIERVYHRHRLWPPVNTQPQPSFEERLPAAVLRRKVEDGLLVSSLLAEFWRRPITDQQLTAELERLTQRSRRPEMLRELFAALGNDPHVVRECLVRPVLADRLGRRAYEFDARLHASTRAHAEQLRTKLDASNFASWPEGDYEEVSLRLESSADVAGPAARVVNQDELDDRTRGFPVEEGTVSYAEEALVFVFRLTRRRSETGFEGSVRVLRKTSYDEWLAEMRRTRVVVLPKIAPSEARESLPEIIEGPLTPDSWAIEEFSPSGRGRHAAVWTGAEMVIYGGGGTRYETGGRYNPALDVWRPIAAGVNVGRRGQAAVWTGGEVLLWGGGGRYDPVRDRWTPMTAVGAPVDQHGSGGVWTGAEFIVWGGDAPDSRAGRYAAATDSWVLTAPAPSQGRYPHLVWTGAELLTWNTEQTAVGLRYDPLTDIWSSLPSAGMPGAGSAVWTGSELLVWDGVAGGRLSPGDTAWTGLSTVGAPPPSRAVWMGSEMLTWGGFTSGEHATGARYHPGLDRWLSIPAAPLLSPRAEHSLVWTGTELIVWGGTASGSETFADGARYDPALDSWLLLPPGPRGDYRVGDKAVSTGAEVLFWGGLADSGVRYDRVLDRLSPMSAIGAPAAREHHSGIWTGTEFLIWGGSSDSVGHRYDPSTDQWTTTTTVGAPSPRLRHTAVWSGSEMLVWAGKDALSTATLGDGGAYDPASDSWRSLPNTGSPGDRDKHSAVWTGAEMIVWGGCLVSATCPGTELATGAALDLGTGLWRPLPTLAAPTARYLHQAQWTGQQMLIIGGGGSNPNRSASYDPIADAWTDAGPMSARTEALAVWTGFEAVVWGGTALTTGGFRHEPGSVDWRELPLGNPVQRERHAMVWTGDEMIILGGEPNSSLGILFPNTPPTSRPTIDGGSVSTITLGGVIDSVDLGHDLPTAWWDTVENGVRWDPLGKWHIVDRQSCSGLADYFSPFSAWYAGNSLTCLDDPYSIARNELTSLDQYPVEADTLLLFRSLLDLDDQGSYKTDLVLPIADNDPTGTVVALVVSDTLVLNGIEVTVTIRHPRASDLTLTLIAPDGTRVILADAAGGGGADFEGTRFADRATQPIGSGVAPLRGLYDPTEPLSVLIGHPTRGAWRLEVIDGVAGEVGVLEHFAIAFPAGDTVEPDRARVEVNAGAGWVRVATSDRRHSGVWDGVRLADDRRTWGAASLRLADYVPVGSTVSVRFTLDVDATNGDGLGWLIDDIGIGQPAGDGSISEAILVAANGSVARPTVPYHDRWDRATFEWLLNGDATADNPDPQTPLLTLAETDLLALGLAEVGDHTLRLRVTDLLGLVDEATVTLSVVDAEPPTTSVVHPNGGEFWLLDSDEIITWEMADNTGICSVLVELLYWDAIGMTWVDVPGDSLPQTLPAPGACPPTEATATSLPYTVPAVAPPGSRYRVRVTPADQSGNVTEEMSERDFFIVAPNPDTVRTLIVHHAQRMVDVGVITAGEEAELRLRLGELAAHPRVLGHVVDLGDSPGLVTLYAAWDAATANAALANGVLFADGGVQDAILGALSAYTGVEYLVLVGDDRIIPHARIEDPTRLLPESDYIGSGLDLTTLTTVGQALAGDSVLSDDPIAVVDAIDPDDLDVSLFIPDLAVGRLVATADDIAQTISTYISQDGVVDLGDPLDLTAHKVLVTGYDHLDDSARRIRSRWKSFLGDPGTDASLAPVDGRLIGGDWNLASTGLRRTALRDHLGGNGAQRYAVVSLNGHANHYLEGVPGTGGDPFDIQGLGAIDIAGSDSCVPPTASLGPLDLSGSIVYSSGCHGGLHVAESCTSDPDHSLDLVEAMLQRGVVAYISNSGFGWGLRHGVGYGERLMEILTEELTRPGTVAVGDAMVRAKQRYVLESSRLDGYDRKSVAEWTTWGLPMYAVNTGVTQLHSESSSPPFAVVRSFETRTPLPDFVTQLQLFFSFSDASYQKWQADGDVEPLASGCSNADGCYYTLNGVLAPSSGSSDLPLQPLLIYDSRLSGTSQHGALWLGGSYFEEPWIPLVGELQSNGAYSNGSVPSPVTIMIEPITPRVIPGLDPDQCRPSDLELNGLVVSTGESYRSDGSTIYDRERTYRSSSLQVFYFNNTVDGTGNCDRTEPTFLPGPFGGDYHELRPTELVWRVPASDVSGVWRVVVVWTDGALNASEIGQWQSLELVDDGSSTFDGTLPLSAVSASRLTYVLQAVDTRGNVSWLDWQGAQLPPSGEPLGVPLTVEVAMAAAVLEVTTCAVVDEQCPGGGPGDGDGEIEPGERIRFSVTLANSGAGVASDVRGSVTVTGGVVVSGGFIGSAGAPLDIPASGSVVHDVLVRVTGSCGDALSLSVPELTASGGNLSFTVDTSTCDRTLAPAPSCDVCACAATPPVGVVGNRLRVTKLDPASLHFDWTGATVTPPSYGVHVTEEPSQVVLTWAGIGDEPRIAVVNTSTLDTVLLPGAPLQLFVVVPVDDCDASVVP